MKLIAVKTATGIAQINVDSIAYFTTINKIRPLVIIHFIGGTCLETQEEKLTNIEIKIEKAREI